ncbi:MAG: L7Ae/L30e/S12e/Gadd45 family ribosomal protein [Chitinophagales bacterium]
MKKNIYQLIGLACKAGQVSSGSMAAKTSIIRRRAKLLIISQDISEKTREGLVAIAKKSSLPWVVLGDKFKLGAHVGKAYRVALTINDDNLADSILQVLHGMSADEAISTGVVEWRK